MQRLSPEGICPRDVAPGLGEQGLFPKDPVLLRVFPASSDSGPVLGERGLAWKTNGFWNQLYLDLNTGLFIF